MEKLNPVCVDIWELREGDVISSEGFANCVFSSLDEEKQCYTGQLRVALPRDLKNKGQPFFVETNVPDPDNPAAHLYKRVVATADSIDPSRSTANFLVEKVIRNRDTGSFSDPANLTLNLIRLKEDDTYDDDCEVIELWTMEDYFPDSYYRYSVYLVGKMKATEVKKKFV
jgi:hypothetical protein